MCESVRCLTILAVKTFYHQIIGNLPQNVNEIVRFLQTYEICFSETMGFLKKTWIFSKSVKVPNLLENAYQIILFHENVFFSTWIDGFWTDKKKFKFGKNVKFSGDSIFFEKERFHSSEKYP